MDTAVFKLNFKTPVHFGNKRLSDGEMTIAADTLFSALFIECLQLNINTDWLMNELVISDTFPYENEIYYLPKPLIRVRSNESSSYKEFKKLKYVPTYHYKEYMDGKLTDDDAKDLNEIFNVGRYMLQTKVSLINQMNDSSEDSEPFSVGTFTFEEDAGLYFIARGTENAICQLNKVLMSLQYSGLGGKRSAGYGRFEVILSDNQEILELMNSKGDTKILLSMAMAKESEIESSCQGARYILSKRSGFIQSPTYSENLLKKRGFYSFTPGSAFINKFDGDIFDVGVQGSHPVYRYAKPLWLEV
ncbi:CRISPR-associated protein Csm4 [Staphylococcus microti]|uniref:CRISPR system Cms protein Csm4 n=1 Tax=Staphylococcus microti TaxID=569857 RepID=A0A0D6XRY2_9STAP|nr:type III-A CRISPR-associated RAMP protein Csm4 [Staphylococcus microti]KIX91210.1 CRISPR-associated protein Csm4 [Staphylococcus microti]PNZ79923.1 type III-A CRISPR-associated RAMP protein Csm4 [Staphylococcus microti]SUM56461.1 CRISPR-associated Csm4 family protein [Staphylococcus microti]